MHYNFICSNFELYFWEIRVYLTLCAFNLVLDLSSNDYVYLNYFIEKLFKLKQCSIHC